MLIRKTKIYYFMYDETFIENIMTKEKIKEIRTLINENFTQKPSTNDRFCKHESSKHLEPKFENYSQRDEFSRDADRILYSKAFRRLEHKAQVYSNKRGDHYRTRLTHTLEVNQIARSISRNLCLNERLTEAIALGHDIGHTPFGHAGEEVLNKIMKGEDDLGGKIEFSIDYGGFKHNFNSVKILEIVEKREKGIGLNLTWQTLDGILKHTKVTKQGKKWDLNRFVRDVSNYKPFISYDYFDEDSEPSYIYPLTLEGQVVAISDEIAQREHDLDDSLRDGELFRFEEIFKKIKEFINEIKEDLKPDAQGYELFLSFYNKISEFDKIENTMQWKELTSIIISYFIIDVTENTMKTIAQYSNFEDIILNENNHKYITELLVDFSETGKKVNDKIEEFIEKRIINSFNVNRFDGKGKFILRQLFKAYYENPRQMPRKQLIILVKNIKIIIDEYPQLKEEFEDLPIDFKELFNINENYVDLNNLKPLLDILKLKPNSEPPLNNIKSDEELSEFLLKILKEMNLDIDTLKMVQPPDDAYHYFMKSLFNHCNSEELSEIEKLQDKNLKDFLLSVKGWSELHYNYLSTICDYISQMTDDYAIKEYQELYLSN